MLPRIVSPCASTFGRWLFAAGLFAASLAAQVPSESLGLVVCDATSVPPTVRSEGIAELVGEIVLTCENTPPSSGENPTLNGILTNVSVSLNVDVTNNINFGQGSNVTDAVLVVNENNCSSPSAIGADYSGCGGADPRIQNPQLGKLVSGNRLEWREVVLPVPGASVTGRPVADCSAGGTLEPGELASGCFPFVTTIRIASIRANGSQLGPFFGDPVTAFVSITGPTSVPVTNNLVDVARPVSALVSSITAAPAGFDCEDTVRTANVNIREGFATAFKPIRSYTFRPPHIGNESGYPVPGSNRGGGASHGTRFILRFFNVPSGVEVRVPKLVETGDPLVEIDGLRLQWVNGAGPDGRGGAISPETDDLLVGLSGGFGQAVYEVVDADIVGFDVADIPVTVSWSADAPGIGAVQMSLSLAPISAVTTANATAPEPRFIDASGNPITITSVADCAVTSFLTTCAATAVPPVVRAEGLTELAGEIVMVCTTQNPPAVSAALVNLSVSLNVNVTNNINFGAGANVTDAVLIVNENNCTSPSATASRFGGCGADNAFVQDPQFGVLTADNRLEWNSVHFPFPGAAIPASGGLSYPAVTSLRVSSIRANASQLGVPGAATFPSTQITAFVSITAPTTISITNNVLNIAVPILGLIREADAPITGLQCQDADLATDLTLREGFATALKNQGAPSFTPHQTQTESGYFAPGSSNGGGAVSGTRILLRFFNVPAGVAVRVPKVIDTGSEAATGDGLRLHWVSGADSNGGGGVVSAETDDLLAPLTTGFGSVAYEVMDSDPFRVETVVVPVTLQWTADTANDLPAIGSMQMSASLAPLSTVVRANQGAPEPRFLENTADPSTLLSIERCTTTLLFPHVSNQNGDDTRIVIANASGLAGAAASDGSCTIHYHGETTGGGAAPVDQTSTLIPAGGRLDMALSAGAAAQGIPGGPEFAGYLISVCDFQAAQGRAVVTDAAGQVFELDAEPIDLDSGSREVVQQPLVLPFVSSRDGRHTEMTIANTSQDWLGTDPVAGACALDFVGQNAPPPLNTATLAGGESLTLDLDAVAPGFEGYVVADCGFPLARALARITQNGAADVPAFSVPVQAAPYDSAGGMGFRLLIPHASTRGSDETWLALSNTTASSIASPVDGSCTLRYHGVFMAPQSFPLDAGEQVLFPLSAGYAPKNIAPAPDFAGHLSISCSTAASAYAYSTSGADLVKRAAFGRTVEAVTPPRSTTPEPVVYPLADSGPGRDRAIVLDNTTADAFLTPPANGFCLLQFRGQGAPADVLVPMVINETLRFPLSQGLPSEGIPPLDPHSGFLLADCDFPLARGIDYALPAPAPPAPGQPLVSGMGPRSGAASRQTFTFEFDDEQGWEDLGVVNVLINDFLDGRNACYIGYSVPLNALYLVPDIGGGLSGGIAPGQPGVIANSQCTIHTATSSARGFGRTLALELDISFNPGVFGGAPVVYLAARDQLERNSGWRPSGVWRTSPTAAAAPTVLSLTPGAAAGTQMTLSVTYRAPSAASDFSAVQLLVNSALDGRNACYLGYDPAFNNLFLLDDPGPPVLLPAVQPGSAGTVENSQCRIDAGASSASQNGTDLTLNLAVTFKGLSGPAIAYGAGQTSGGGNSGWQAVGSFQVR